MKALKYLQKADVVLTDRLVSPILIEENARMDAEVIYVGKQCSKGIHTPQKDINELILNGMTENEIMEIIKNNTYSGAIAKLKLNQWKKC